VGSVKEKALRARARKLGYAIHKSRSRSIHEDNLGRYALVKEDSNLVVLGERFDASLEEIAEYLDWDYGRMRRIDDHVAPVRSAQSLARLV